MLASALVALLFQAAPVFAPPLDQPLLLITERVETEGDVRRAYRARMLVRFARDGDGYRAEVTVLDAGGTPGRDESAMFEAGLSGLEGRTLHFRLDANGNVTAISGREELWHAFCLGLARVMAERKTADPDARARLQARLVAPLEALPPERQMAMLASLLTPAIATEAGDQPFGSTRAVRLPGRSPFGGSAMLEGTRTVARPDDTLRVETRARGTVASRAGAPAEIALTVEERSDAATGLIRLRRETRETRLDGGGRTLESVKTVTLAPAPADAGTAP